MGVATGTTDGEIRSRILVVRVRSRRGERCRDEWLWTGVGILGVSVICGLVALLRLLFSSRKELPRRLVLSRLVFPAYLTGTLVFAISMPVYHAIERHWFAKDAIT